MTTDRAKYILANTVLGNFKFAFTREGGSNIIHEDGITEAEHKVIMDLWNTMPGTTCYHDAVVRIAKGVQS